MHTRMSTAREQAPLSPPPSFAPFGRAVLESIDEGLVVFDSHGRLLYANQQARRAVSDLEDLASTRPEALRRRLATLGGRAKTLQVGPGETGEAVFLPVSADHRGGTLAEREKKAIVEMLDATGGRLAEAARRLGISRTTLWRRLRSYGLDRFRETR